LVPGACLFTITQSNAVEVTQQQDQCDQVCFAEHYEEQLITSNEEEQLITRNEEEQVITHNDEEQLITSNEEEQLGTLNMLPLPLPEYLKKALHFNSETDTLSSAEQLFYYLVLSEDECSIIEFLLETEEILMNGRGKAG